MCAERRKKIYTYVCVRADLFSANERGTLVPDRECVWFIMPGSSKEDHTMICESDSASSQGGLQLGRIP